MERLLVALELAVRRAGIAGTATQGGTRPELGKGRSVAVAFAVIAALLLADFGYVLWRASREWRRTDDLSPATAHCITSLYVLTAALLVVSVAWRPWPLPLSLAVSVIFGAAAVLTGVALARPGFARFAGVKELWGVQRGGLITEGIYRYSRHPQYTGIGIALIGVAVIVRSGLGLAVVAAYWIAIRIWVVLEERHLQRAFGEQYVAYRDRTPRFLGLPRGD